MQIQVSPANNKINLSNFNSDKKTRSAAVFWRMYKCRHEFHWNAVKVTVFPQTLTLSSQTSRQKKTQGFELWVIVAFASLKPHFPTTLFRPKLYSVSVSQIFFQIVHQNVIECLPHIYPAFAVKGSSSRYK